jgi:hypothetical protein
VLFFIELGTRRVHFAGCTPSPSGAWVVQQARNPSFTKVLERTRFLIHDRDNKFTAAFDDVFRSEGITVIHTPCERRRRTPTQSGLLRLSRRLPLPSLCSVLLAALFHLGFPLLSPLGRRADRVAGFWIADALAMTLP